MSKRQTYRYRNIYVFMVQTLVEKVISALALEKDVEASQLDIELETYISTDVIAELESHDSDAWRLQFETPNHVIEISGNDTVQIY